MKNDGLSDVDIRQAVLVKYGDNVAKAVFSEGLILVARPVT
jgi:hypothetical protein